jgi:hypothetical protein
MEPVKRVEVRLLESLKDRLIYVQYECNVRLTDKVRFLGRDVKAALWTEADLCTEADL